MPIGLLTLTLQIPACRSLKEKRGRLKPLLARLQREFNLSAAEMGANDRWDEAILACALVSSDAAHAQSALQNVSRWVEHNWPDVLVVEQHIETLV